MAKLSNSIAKADVAPAISIDVANRLAYNLNKFREILGVTGMRAVPEGSTLKVYNTAIVSLANQVDECQEIALTNVTRSVAQTITLSLKKYRKMVSIEAIQQSGLDAAVNDTDAELVKQVQKAVKGDLFTALASGTGTASGATFQAALANAWGKLQSKFEDYDVRPVFFINPVDVATYLGSASITTQEAFGMTYVENFLGLGTAILTASVTSGTFIATASENLNCAYVPASGDVGAAMGYTSDETGLVCIKHAPKDENAGLQTIVVTGVAFYAEDLSGVFKGTIGGVSA